jgi:hypothetical protein
MDHALTQVRRIGGWHEVLLALSPGTLANRADSRKVVMQVESSGSENALVSPEVVENQSAGACGMTV